MDSTKINPVALKKLRALNETFCAVFRDIARRGWADSDDPWSGGAIAPVPDKAQYHKNLDEYSAYNSTAGHALMDLETYGSLFGKKEEAVQALTGLKAVFDDKALHFAKASRNLYSSLHEEIKLAKKYKGYSNELADVLKLL